MNRQRKNKPVTIKNVAEHANASISTVSNILNNKGYVSEEKKQQVLKSIKALGYTPNASARSLASSKTGNIGFILRESHFTRSEPFYTRIFLGAEFESKQHSYYVILSTIPDSYTLGQDTPRLLRERNVDGVIVAGKVDDAFLVELEDTDLPFVLVDYRYGDHSEISVDNRGGAIEAIRYLVEKNHHNIAFLGADATHPSIRERLEGYQIGLIKYGLSVNPDLVILREGAMPIHQTGYELAGTIMSMPDRPSAVFCANDAMAIGLIRGLLSSGISVPQDIAVVGFDDVDGASFSNPPLTTVRIHKEQFGELAMRHMVDRIENPIQKRSAYSRRSEKITLPTDLIIRSSA